MIALGMSVGFTAFIFIFWISGSYIQGVSVSKDRSGGEPSPFSVLSRYTNEFLAEAGSVITGARSLFDEIGFHQTETYQTEGLLDDEEDEIFTKPEDLYQEQPEDEDVPESIEEGEGAELSEVDDAIEVDPEEEYVVEYGI